jgi:hypothetical protein
MAYPNNPDDPYRYDPAADDIRRAVRRDNELQPDPELSETPASSTRIALYALAAAIVLGFVFYGLNNSSVHEAGTTPASQSAQNQPASPPAPPPGMRDVTPKANTNPGVTTGAAPNRPPQPNDTTIDRPAPPPAGTNDNPPAAPK